MMDLRISAFGLMGASNFPGTKLLLKIPEPKTTTDFYNMQSLLRCPALLPVPSAERVIAWCAVEWSPALVRTMRFNIECHLSRNSSAKAYLSYQNIIATDRRASRE